MLEDKRPGLFVRIMDLLNHRGAAFIIVALFFCIYLLAGTIGRMYEDYKKLQDARTDDLKDQNKFLREAYNSSQEMLQAQPTKVNTQNHENDSTNY